MANVVGPDISVFNDLPQTPQGVDFVKMKSNSGFVVVRVGQGQLADADFKVNWAAAKKSGLPRGAYWYYDSRSEPKAQADLCAQTLGADPGELPVFADFEDTNGGPYAGWQNWKIFLEQLKSLLSPQEVGIYTAFFYWQQNAPSPVTQADALQSFHAYPLWIANYGVPAPAIPAPWAAGEWLFWQYSKTGNGPTYGAESPNIDLNYFHGDLTAFNHRFKVGPPGPPPPPPPNPVGTTYQVTAISLNMRAGPGTNYLLVGTLKQNDLVLGTGANADQSWLEVRRADGLLGWCSAAYLSAVPTPPPAPPPVPVSPYYQVTAAVLNVRSGPGTTNPIVGSLKQNDVVSGVAISNDGAWIQISRPDGLTGWCAGQYLAPMAAPPPPPAPVPVSPQYQAAAGLNIRSGPGTTFPLVGTLKQNDLVAGLAASNDGSWIEIRRADGLTGWCSSQYLTPRSGPPPPPPAPVPVSAQYKALTGLNIRSGPGTGFALVGTLKLNDVVAGLAASGDGSWIQIRRADGLTGWCSSQYLSAVSPP